MMERSRDIPPARISGAWRRLSRALAGSLALLGLAGCTDPQGNGRCVIDGFGNIPILNRQGSPIVRASVNGHPVAFIVDSGSYNSTISPRSADQLGLNANGATGLVGGVDGPSMASVQTARTIALGTGQARDAAFLVADLPQARPVSGLPVVGLFGAEFMLNYDIVLDQPDTTMSLLHVTGCSMPAPLWSGMMHLAPIDIDGPGRNKIGVTLMVNGKRVTAALDSGASTTTIPLDDAHRAGVTDAMLDQDVKIHVRGVGNTPITGWRHRFATLGVGSITLNNVVLTVLPDQDYALLGDDFLRGHRVWIPRNGNTMYIQSRAEIPANDPARKAAESP
ncbi:retroviral-like aspartic protease family protein [Tanticharoenia sakaeratensis]|jgi:predicted aspartyl protease|uniref:Peptidase A2 domain-containing protein n=1 Tax=Tanticharoenia sakaeratensis NBRC 103193 TaxID=1231623 RepID=A0A0D6MK26_9PROT|nr:retroviral-like aspartic protease family protein [Tanticharoenia sakaeratensis]GAN53790.1 hypothetical protein Tasa_011_009 [Tanticharoenia sakaeratensis NBRC 103193]